MNRKKLKALSEKIGFKFEMVDKVREMQDIVPLGSEAILEVNIGFTSKSFLKEDADAETYLYKMSNFANQLKPYLKIDSTLIPEIISIKNITKDKYDSIKYHNLSKESTRFSTYPYMWLSDREVYDKFCQDLQEKEKYQNFLSENEVKPLNAIPFNFSKNTDSHIVTFGNEKSIANLHIKVDKEGIASLLRVEFDSFFIMDKKYILKCISEKKRIIDFNHHKSYQEFVDENFSYDFTIPKNIIINFLKNTKKFYVKNSDIAKFNKVIEDVQLEILSVFRQGKHYLDDIRDFESSKFNLGIQSVPAKELFSYEEIIYKLESKYGYEVLPVYQTTDYSPKKGLYFNAMVIVKKDEDTEV